MCITLPEQLTSKVQKRGQISVNISIFLGLEYTVISILTLNKLTQVVNY